MSKFINRTSELEFLNKEYKQNRSSFIVIYGRRRIGKTALIRNFIKDKPSMYFLASEEMEMQNINNLKELAADFTGNVLLKKGFDFTWEDIFTVVKDYKKEIKKVIVIDEFQYLGKINKAFPSVFQRIWDTILKDENIMVILCGSLINMMESQTLSYSSPLYGRRTGQIKMKQISFNHYKEFFDEKGKEELIEYFSVTGGVPKYIELFKEERNIFEAIKSNIINKQSFLYEEPIFLLEQEVGDIGTYFSIIKTIAAGNHKLGKIASVLGVSQTNLTRYLKTLMDLDLIERTIPITESNPEKSKKGLYYIKDNFIQFWFKFIYPYRSYIEIEDIDFVMKKIEHNFIDNHVSFVFEEICKEEVWNLSKENKLPFRVLKVGKWWDSSNEIDIVGINDDTKDILIGECKYLNTKVDTDIFYKLIEKGRLIDWNKESRKEQYILFSKSGFSDELIEMSRNRKDVLLISLNK